MEARLFGRGHLVSKRVLFLLFLAFFCLFVPIWGSSHQDGGVEYLSGNEDVQVLLSELSVQREFGRSRGQVGLVVSTSSRESTRFFSLLSTYLEGVHDGATFLVLDMDVCFLFFLSFFSLFSHTLLPSLSLVIRKP